MSVLARLPAEASAEETAAAILDELERRAAARGLLAGDEPQLLGELRGAIAEIVRKTEIAHGLGLGPCTCGGAREADLFTDEEEP